MAKFMDKDFILSNETAKKLYHNVAAKLPIIDYHCHIDPREIAENSVCTNITQLWLYGDHYKWRAMRSCGVEEKYITGDASDYEKFKAFATIMPDLIGNPMYHWSHLELKRYFDCDLILCEENVDAIWKMTADKLAEGNMSVLDIIKKSNVEALC
ncbi:MAG: glucuronate isomerase, partial [Clostridia bacterium]|nr:glucuronate isomerase [Clostridia bacterium]